MSMLKTRLEATIGWAEKIRNELGPLQLENGDRVHFRPSATGAAMVGLTHDRPQRGKSGIRTFRKLIANFEDDFKAHCLPTEKGRDTPEKALQSFLIRNALSNARRMKALEKALGANTEVLFTTDELSLPDGEDKIVCDVLALRDGHTPVIVELKSARHLGRLVQQVKSYADIIDDHRDQFSRLYSVILGWDVTLRHAAEKWIVWPPPSKGDRGPGDDEVPDDIQVFVYRTPGPGEYVLTLVP